MKKIMILALTCICLVSCDYMGFGYNKPIGDKNTKGVDYVVRFEYDGHKYIMFERIQYENMSGVVHDPDCPCHNK